MEPVFQRTKHRFGPALAALAAAALTAIVLVVAGLTAVGPPAARPAGAGSHADQGATTGIGPATALNGTMQDRPSCRPHCPETYTDNNTGPK